jgi:hypothetical protein
MLPKRFLRLPVGPDTAKLTALDQKSKPARFKNGFGMHASLGQKGHRHNALLHLSLVGRSAAQHIHFAGV